MHPHFDLTRWLLGIAWTWDKADRALFIHMGPLCIGFHRHDYYTAD